MADDGEPIQVTKSYLPPLEEYTEYLRSIWETNQLTNNGPLVKRLEAELKSFLGVKHLFFVSNGTIAIQIAIKALKLWGEIITTPFSYVATTSSIVWEGLQPVFADIDPQTLNINPALIEKSITPRTTAIMPVHVYGYPCDVERIETIAKRHGLKVIYDAAHAFGGRYLGESICSFGDIATLSFHATKLFHTVEGGAIVTNDDEAAHRIAYLRNFGHRGPEEFWGLGVNGKNSEFHAAMGLCILPKVPELIEQRREVSEAYDRLIAGSPLKRPEAAAGTQYNYAYYPVIYPSEAELLASRAAMNANQIFPRRYFYPSLDNLPYIEASDASLAADVSRRVLCLPLYPGLELECVEEIARLAVEPQAQGGA